jgi:hypothetical protein
LIPRDKKSAFSFSLFLWVLRCFTSPRSLHTTYVFSRGSIGFTNRGCPIQRFPDQRLLATSPRLIAGCHVFRRLLHTKPSTICPYVLRPSRIASNHDRTAVGVFCKYPSRHREEHNCCLVRITFYRQTLLLRGPA